jgi:flagellar biosynthesis regulator FlaF
MDEMAQAINAYTAAAGHRSLRQQEAEVFRRVNAELRNARTANGLARVRALAKTDQLWLAVSSAVRDPANQLPVKLRAQLVSIARAVQREVQSAEPDIEFLVAVNENVAAGLDGESSQTPG